MHRLPGAHIPPHLPRRVHPAGRVAGGLHEHPRGLRGGACWGLRPARRAGGRRPRAPPARETFRWPCYQRCASPTPAAIVPAKQEVLKSMSASDKDKIDAMKTTPNIYERLAAAIAPTVYGHDEIKRGILLMLLGGVQKVRRRAPPGRRECASSSVGARRGDSQPTNLSRHGRRRSRPRTARVSAATSTCASWATRRRPSPTSSNTCAPSCRARSMPRARRRLRLASLPRCAPRRRAPPRSSAR